MLLVFLWVKICFVKQRGLEEIRDADGKSLTQFVDDPKFDGIIRTMDDIADGGFGDTTAGG